MVNDDIYNDKISNDVEVFEELLVDTKRYLMGSDGYSNYDDENTFITYEMVKNVIPLYKKLYVSCHKIEVKALHHLLGPNLKKVGIVAILSYSDIKEQRRGFHAKSYIATCSAPPRHWADPPCRCEPSRKNAGMKGPARVPNPP